MTNERHIQLDRAADPHLTEDELRAGWHFCPDWDYLLVGPGMRHCQEGCTFRNRDGNALVA